MNMKRRNEYFKIIGKNSTIMIEYVIQSIVDKPDDIENNYETLKGLISSADEIEGCISKDDANKLLNKIKEAIDHCNNNTKAFYLLSLNHLFCKQKNQESVFNLKTIQSF